MASCRQSGTLMALGVLASAVVVAPALAESARMTGKFAAPYRDAAMLDTLRIGRFSGQDGAQFELAVERAIANAIVDGRPHFGLVGGRGGDADGVLNGNVTTGVQTNRFKRKEKKCVERKDGKCLREDEVEVDCTRRVINVNIDLRLTRRDDGRIVYSASKPRRDETSWCQGQNPPRTTEEAVRQTILSIAADVRYDIAPKVENYSIRFRETTRGLPRELTRPFRDIVKMTQRDLRAACAAWQAMDGQAPNHPSIVFDLGLCAEAAGDFARAMALYRRAAPLIGRGGNEATVGAARVGRLIAAREDDAQRSRARRGQGRR